MSERMSIAAEIACVAVISAGVALLSVPAALIIGGGLVLLGMQGIGRREGRE